MPGVLTCAPVHTHEPTWGQAAPRMPELLFLPSQQCLKTSPGRVSLTYLPSPHPYLSAFASLLNIPRPGLPDREPPPPSDKAQALGV